MPFSMLEFVRTHRALSLRIVGLLIFLVAFALPAVRVGKRADMFSPTFTGYECARIASTGIYELVRWPAVTHHDDNLNFNDTLLLAMSGLINPLVIAQFLSFAQKRRRVGTVLGALTVVCMLATWLLFTHLHITPLVGHVLWIVGAGTCGAANALRNEQDALVR